MFAVWTFGQPILTLKETRVNKGKGTNVFTSYIVKNYVAMDNEVEQEMMALKILCKKIKYLVA